MNIQPNKLKKGGVGICLELFNNGEEKSSQQQKEEVPGSSSNMPRTNLILEKEDKVETVPQPKIRISVVGQKDQLSSMYLCNL